MKSMDVVIPLQIILVFQDLINRSYTAPSDDDEGRKSQKSYTRWTSEMQTAFNKICKTIPSDKPYYFDRLREKWHELYPNYNVSDRTLLSKMYRTPEDLTGRVKRSKRNLEWDDEKTNELIDLYLNSRPYNKSHPAVLREEWARRYPDFPELTTSQLTVRARKYLKKRSSQFEGESSQRLFEWTDNQDSDLYHIYHVTLPEARQQPIHMHRIWTDLYPDYRELTYDQLAERVTYLQKHPPDELFPWTKGHNKELLDIYHSTSPGVADQGRRIHEIWSKIHPKYSFMTPYYLQIHASTLAHHEETGSNRRKYIKFTAEQEANLANIYQRLAKRNGSLYDFHKAWVQEYPALAHLIARSLSKRAKRLIAKDDCSGTGAYEGVQLSENIKLGRRNFELYSPEDRAHLFDAYRQTYPRDLGSSKLSRNDWITKNKDAADVKGASLMRMIRKWNKEDSERKGKAPMVIPKVEEESEHSSNTSDSLE